MVAEGNLRTITPLLAAAALYGITLSTAQALTIEAAVDYSLGAGAPMSNIDGPANSGSVDVLFYDSDTAGNTVFAHTFGDTNGSFGSRVSGTGTYDITGTFSYSETFTNNTAVDQFYNMDFTVVAGNLSVDGAPTGTESVLAGYTIDILLNGDSIWDSAATLTLDENGATFTELGSTSLGGASSPLAFESASYSWTDYLGNVDLGLFAAGDSFTLSYNMVAYATGNLTAPSGITGAPRGCGLECLDTGPIFEGCDGETGCGETLGGSTSRTGDPFQISGAASPFTGLSGTPAVVTVPAPGSLALLGLGLLGLRMSRRRR